MVDEAKRADETFLSSHHRLGLSQTAAVSPHTPSNHSLESPQPLQISFTFSSLMDSVGFLVHVSMFPKLYYFKHHSSFVPDKL